MAQENNSSNALWFVAGVALGATIALLFAPASGEDTRRKIVETAGRGREKLNEAGREIVGKSKELYEKGRGIADDAASLLERGRKLVEG
jgi:gas vesicle protein